MREVIREGVFETNSSSAHSVTLKKYNKEGECCHFVILSPLYKVLFLRGLIGNAEMERESALYWREQEAKEYLTKEKITKEIAKERLLALAEEEYKNFGYSPEEIEALKDKDEDELCAIAGLMPEDDLACVFGFDPSKPYREFCREFYSAVRKVYCESEGITDEELTKKCNEMPYGEDGNDEYRVSCEQFFADGSLDVCNCGFGDYYDISDSLEKALEYDKYQGSTMEEIHLEKAGLFLSDEYCFACCEEYCSFCISEFPTTPTDEIL